MLKYKIFVQLDVTICAPSSDYYARGNDWESNNLVTLRQYNDKTFDSIEECRGYLYEIEEKGEFLFIPTFII